MLHNGQVLGAHTFALAALYTVLGFAKLTAQNLIIGEIDRPALFRQILPHILVVEREILRDGNVFGAALSAVGAAGAGDGNLTIDDVRRLITQRLFLLGQRLEVLHIAEIVLHLLHTGHSCLPPAE